MWGRTNGGLIDGGDSRGPRSCAVGAADGALQVHVSQVSQDCGTAAWSLTVAHHSIA
jgi:hypothetical protein